MGKATMKPLNSFDNLRASFQDGTINSATDDDLHKAVGVLANTMILNDHVRQQACIMAEGIHSILLHRLLALQERRNSKAQFWFMVLALAGVITATAQIVVALAT